MCVQRSVQVAISRVKPFESLISGETRNVYRFANDASKPAEQAGGDNFVKASNTKSLKSLESGGNIASSADARIPAGISKLFSS